MGMEDRTVRAGRFLLEIHGFGWYAEEKSSISLSYLSKKDFLAKKFDNYKLVRRDLIFVDNIKEMRGRDSDERYDALDEKLINKICTLLTSFEIISEKENLNEKEVELKNGIVEALLTEGVVFNEQKVSELTTKAIAYFGMETYDEKIEEGEQIGVAVEEEKARKQKEQEEAAREKQIKKQMSRAKRKEILKSTGRVLSMPVTGMLAFGRVLKQITNDVKEDVRKRQARRRVNDFDKEF